MWPIRLKINVGHSDLKIISWSIDFALYLEEFFFFGIMSQCDAIVYLIINVGHSDLYSMVQWFCLCLLKSSDISGTQKHFSFIGNATLSCDSSYCQLYKHWFF